MCIRFYFYEYSLAVISDLSVININYSYERKTVKEESTNNT